MSGKRFEEKVALVTGGASGIGKAIVLAMVSEGAKVAFTDISPDAGRVMEAELAKRGADVMFAQSDATREADVAALIEQIVQRFGRLDVGINNVGGFGAADMPGAPLHETTLAGWESTLAVSMTSNFLCMKHEIRQMLKQNGGVIANTASLAAMRVTPNATPAYTAGKAGVIHLTEYAAVLYAKYNIRVNAVAPGLTATQGVLSAFTPEQRNAMAAETQPMGRMLTPEEQANAFLWICSDQASGVTGLTIPVDGGWAAK